MLYFLINFLGVEQSSAALIPLNDTSLQNIKNLPDQKNLANGEILSSNMANNTFIKNFLNSDAEFAAYLGILDIDPTTIVSSIILLIYRCLFI